MKEKSLWLTILRNNKWQENILHAILWTIVFAASPLIELIKIQTETAAAFSWRPVWEIWRILLVILLAWLIHHLVLANLFIERHRYRRYAFWLFILLAAFIFVQRSLQPLEPRMKDDALPARPMDDRRVREGGDQDNALRPFSKDAARPDTPPLRHREPMEPIPHGWHNISALFFLAFAIVVNLIIKQFFHMRENDERINELKKISREKQLDYLKYQLNPHFFMNTLNNIHALVDINPERAKTAVVELSELTRYVLREGSKTTVSLRSDIDFLSNYIQLMRLRYTDKVAITVNISEPLADIEVPPLIFVTYVENAFKHGVSYQKPSFIDITIKCEDGDMVFICRNSRIERTEERKSERVGMENARKRLDLIYGGHYQLNIIEGEKEFSVCLMIKKRNKDKRS